MTKSIYRASLSRVALIGLTLALSACGSTESQPKPQAATLTIFVDSSASTAFISSPAYADAAIRRVGEAVMRQKLGDSVRIVNFGERSIDNAVDVFAETSGYSNRLPALRKHVTAKLKQVMDSNRQSGGQHATNISFSIENAHLTCTPDSRVVILSDGIAEDETYSVSRALITDEPVRLPKPAAPYLKNCAVEMIGIGIAPISSGQSVEVIRNDQLQRLKAGWSDYLSQAGVRPQDMSFISLL